MEIAIVLPDDEKKLMKLLKKLDKREDYGDNKNFWLCYGNPMEEMIFEKDGALYISSGSGNMPSVFLTIGFGELINQLSRFHILDDLFEYIENNYEKIKKDKKKFEELKKLFK